MAPLLASADEDDVASNASYRRRQYGLTIASRVTKALMLMTLLGLVEYGSYSTMSFVETQYPLYLAQLEQATSPPPPPLDIFHCFSCEKIITHSSSLLLLHTCSQCNLSSLSTLPPPLTGQPLHHLIRVTKSHIIGAYISTTFLASEDALHLDVDERASPYVLFQLFFSYVLDIVPLQIHPIVMACWLIMAFSIMGQIVLGTSTTKSCLRGWTALNADIQSDQDRRIEEQRLAKEHKETEEHIERCKLQLAQTFTDNVFLSQATDPFATPQSMDLLSHQQSFQPEGHSVLQPGFGLRQRV